MDLGADGWQTFRFVVWPVLSTALVAGGLLAFALSFDEVIVTTFTAGAQTTLPIFILDNLRSGQQLPVVNVVAFVVILLTIIPVTIAQRLTRDTGILRTRRTRRSEDGDQRLDTRTSSAVSGSTRGGRDDGGAEPGDRRDDRRGAARARRRRRPRGRGGEEGAAGVARRRRPASAPSCCSSSPTCSTRTPRSSPRSSRATSASRSATRATRCRSAADNLRFFAGAARVLEGRSAGEYMRGYTSMIRREPLGIVGGIAPVELPADDGGLEARRRRWPRATSRC